MFSRKFSTKHSISKGFSQSKIHALSKRTDRVRSDDCTRGEFSQLASIPVVGLSVTRCATHCAQKKSMRTQSKAGKCATLFHSATPKPCEENQRKRVIARAAREGILKKPFGRTISHLASASRAEQACLLVLTEILSQFSLVALVLFGESAGASRKTRILALCSLASFLARRGSLRLFSTQSRRES